jgi:hypothetical protein
MSMQALPRRRVASPPPITAAKINRLRVAPPYLWSNLSAETQAQIARILADLLRRMLPTDVAPGREMARADRREPRR